MKKSTVAVNCFQPYVFLIPHPPLARRPRPPLPSAACRSRRSPCRARPSLRRVQFGRGRPPGHDEDRRPAAERPGGAAAQLALRDAAGDRAGPAALDGRPGPGAAADHRHRAAAAAGARADPASAAPAAPAAGPAGPAAATAAGRRPAGTADSRTGRHRDQVGKCTAESAGGITAHGRQRNSRLYSYTMHCCLFGVWFLSWLSVDFCQS